MVALYHYPWFYVDCFVGENVKDLMFRIVALTFNQMVASEISGRNNREAKSIGNNLSKYVSLGNLKSTWTYT